MHEKTCSRSFCPRFASCSEALTKVPGCACTIVLAMFKNAEMDVPIHRISLLADGLQFAARTVLNAALHKLSPTLFDCPEHIFCSAPKPNAD